MARRKQTLTNRIESAKNNYRKKLRLNEPNTIFNQPSQVGNELFIHDDGQFRIIPMPGDGNCMFHSLAYCLKMRNNLVSHLQLRENAVQYICSNWTNRFKDTVRAMFSDIVLPIETAEQYEAYMGTPGVYGGNHELVAISELYGIKIKVYHKNDPEQSAITINQISEDIMCLLYSGNIDKGHYEVLQKAQHETNATEILYRNELSNGQRNIMKQTATRNRRKTKIEIMIRQIQNMEEENDMLQKVAERKKNILINEAKEEKEERIQNLTKSIIHTAQRESDAQRSARLKKKDKTKWMRVERESYDQRAGILIEEAETERVRLEIGNGDQRAGRLMKKAESERVRLERESEDQRAGRLIKKTQSQRMRLERESDEQRAGRLIKKTQSERMRIGKESNDQRAGRLIKKAKTERVRIKTQSDEQRTGRLTKRANTKRMRLERESDEQRAARLMKKSETERVWLGKESDEQRAGRLVKKSKNKRVRIERENDEQRAARLIKNAQTERVRLERQSHEQRAKRLKSKAESQRVSLRNPDNKRPGHLVAYIDGNSRAECTIHDCGEMEVLCESCGSKNFNAEKPPSGSSFSRCCHGGKVKLESLTDYPFILRSLLLHKDSKSRKFMNKIRSYNSSLAFASMGSSAVQLDGRGPYCFKIHGQIYHNTSALYPDQNQRARYAQLYILDSEQALKERLINNKDNDLDEQILKTLDGFLRENNIYAKSFKMMKEVLDQEAQIFGNESGKFTDIHMWITRDRSDDHRRYNAPSCNEIAIVFRNNDGAPPANRDIAIHPRCGGLVPISPLSANCDPMTYPLLFPRGERGWSPKCLHTFGNRRVTLLQFYAYRLSTRYEFNPVLSAGKLTQQYIVDAYVKVESSRLQYVKENQRGLRVELYSGLMDHINNLANTRGVQPGKILILPSSFQGGARCMQQRYQNAMAVVRKYGKPCLLITFTCNPLWAEITRNIEPYQRASDRPDIVARVFYIKLQSLIHDLTKCHVLGVPAAMIHVVEFQKRGLPHAHILLTLSQEDKIRNADDADRIVSAEIPDPNLKPRLFSIVKSSMIHGPCGDANPRAPCMENGVCSKGFPKKLTNNTIFNLNGYPLYQRRNNGIIINIHNRDGSLKHCVDNRWIVPYNPYLLEKYSAHINVEVCSTIKSVKYLYKYVYKGHDCANIELHRDGDKTMKWDEVQMYLDTRYVSAPEAMWRLYEYKMHDQSHSIIPLAVHLPDGQQVYFRSGGEEEALQRAACRNTSLTAYFELNKTDEEASQLLYTEVPEHYVFKNGKWKSRQRRGDKVISRMYSVSPMDIERFHLRLLLLHVKGATSFEDLKTVDGAVCDTFKQAAMMRNLLHDDSEWDRALSEASAFQMPLQLRQMAALIFVFCHPTNALDLWNSHKIQLIEDFFRSNSRSQSENLALNDIERTLIIYGKRCVDFGLPEPFVRGIIEDIEYDRNSMNTNQEVSIPNQVSCLNDEQKHVFHTIVNAVMGQSHERCIFLDGPGGSGKTFLYSTIMGYLREQDKSVIAVAWTGIAATLLNGGRTVHSAFKLPVPTVETSCSDLRLWSHQAQHIKEAGLITWDEATMASKHALDAVDRFLKDLMESDLPFGGKVIVLGGDFRQCLPVVKHGSKVQILEECIKRSNQWKYFKCVKLTKNMRLHNNENDFSLWLLKLGNGQLHIDPRLPSDSVIIPQEFLAKECIIDEIFGRTIMVEDIETVQKRVVLAPKNDDVNEINLQILNRLEGSEHTYISIDSVLCDNVEEEVNYPLEFLNTLKPSGMPPHKLILKVGAIIMLIRNLNTNLGFCNGARLTVKSLGENVINASLITGIHKGERILIPRIFLYSSDTELPFKFRRLQFPVKLAYAMTINKSQGQTMEKVGIYLPRPVFTHGQLYVAFSRCKRKENIKVLIKACAGQGKLNSGETFTKNVVYREVL